MGTKLTSLAVALCASVAPIVLAHHASAGLYDRSTTTALSGEITSVFWRNPHVRLTISVPIADGSRETWEIEAGSVNTLERMGVTADKFHIGDRIDVSGFAGRDGRKVMFANKIASATGEDVPLGADITQRYARPEQVAAGLALDAGPASDIFRVWVPLAVPNTGAGRGSFPLTDAARAARAAWDPADDPVLQCIPPGMPAAMDNPYPIRFERRGGDIVLRLEEWDGVRTIHLNPDSSAQAKAPSPMGYSTGRWEGDTLIVETSGIDYPYFDDLGTPQSEAIHVTERFTLMPEERRLSWKAEITDPESFTEPVTMRIEWQWIPGHTIKPFNCALPEEAQ
jgi:hypothetical protein